MTSPNALTLSVSQFKAQCLELFDKLSRGEINRVIVTKRGAVVATVGPPPPIEEKSLFGGLRGTLRAPGDLDLTAPVFDGEIEAARGAWKPIE